MEKIIYTIPLNEFTEILKKCIREEIKLRTPEIKEEELLKTEDVIKLFGVSKTTLHKWRKKRILPYHRIASRIYFKKAEIIEALNHISKRGKI